MSDIDPVDLEIDILKLYEPTKEELDKVQAEMEMQDEFNISINVRLTPTKDRSESDTPSRFTEYLKQIMSGSYIGYDVEDINGFKFITMSVQELTTICYNCKTAYAVETDFNELPVCLECYKEIDNG